MDGLIFDIKRYAIHDGPGIRTTVFFKGCPLKCEWCQNPESRDTAAQLAIVASRCIRCGACVNVCPNEGNPAAPDRLNCRRCGACAEACPSGARTLLGRRLSISELIEEVAKDELFFDESDGGVTFSGGEPLLQPDYLRECLNACRQRGYHTAIDTSGYAPAEVFGEIAELGDLFLYDLKLIDDHRHREFVGVSNELILANLRKLCERGAEVWIRIPIVPGINDDEDNLAATAELASSLKGHPPVHLLPYHRIGSDKYGRLGIPYSMEWIAPPTAVRMSEIAAQFSTMGLEVRIGG